MENQLFPLAIATRDGRFVARYSGKGLAELDFPEVGTHRRGVRSKFRRADRSEFLQLDHQTPRPVLRSSTAEGGRGVPTNKIPATILRAHRKTVAALKNALAGRAAKNLPPLDLSGGTEFQRRVWKALRKISAGKTKSYGEIAEAIGKPKAVRAVGGACGANPIPVLVPCHRVLAAHGKIGGFGGGLEWKRKLLAREGVKF